MGWGGVRMVNKGGSKERERWMKNWKEATDVVCAGEAQVVEDEQR